MKKCPKPGCGKLHDNSDMYCRLDGTLLKSANELEPGMVVAGEWEILETIAEGGMGSVYRVQQANFKNQESALKVMHPRFASDKDLVARFKTEVKITNLLPKAYVVEVYGTGTLEDGRPFLRMEYVPGKSLQALIHPDPSQKPQPFPQKRALKIAAQVCRALSAAHRHNIIHRDIKPANILVLPQRSGEESVKVLDFGIAKAMEGSPVEDTSMSLSSPGFKGTPPYASPEQCSGTVGNSIGFQTDIYSLGCVLYEMLTGESPFHGRDIDDYLRKHKEEVPAAPRMRRPDLGISESVSALVMKSLEKSVSARFASADEMLSEIERILDDSMEETSEVQNLVDKAVALESQGRAAEARSVLARAVEADPTDVTARQQLSRIRRVIREANTLSLPWGGTVKTVPEWIAGLLESPEKAATAVQDPQLDRWMREVLELPELAEKVKTHTARTGSFWGWFESCFADQLSSADLREKLETLNIETAALLKRAERYAAGKDFDSAEQTYRQVLLRDPGNITAEERIKSVTARLAEKRAYEAANQQFLESLPSSRIAPLEQFLAKYPNGAFASEVRARIDGERLSNLLKDADEACKARKHKEAFDAYAAVLRREPGNVQALQGQKRALTISREEQAWKRAVVSGRPEDLEEYLREFPAPQGFYGEQAAAFLERFRVREFELLLKQAEQFCQDRNDVQAEKVYRAILEKDRDHKKASEGLRRVDAIRTEDQLWRRALTSGQAADFARYLREYPAPTGLYCVEARSRLDRLQQKEIENKLRAADEYCNARMYQDAERLYRDVLEMQPDNRDAHSGLQQAANIRRDEETWLRAREGGDPDLYLRSVPNGAHVGDAQALREQADIDRLLKDAERYLQSGHYSEAESLFRSVLLKEPAAPGAIDGLRRLDQRRRQESHQRATELFNEENKHGKPDAREDPRIAADFARAKVPPVNKPIEPAPRPYGFPQLLALGLCAVALVIAIYFMLPKSSTIDTGAKIDTEAGRQEIISLLKQASDKFTNDFDYAAAIDLYKSVLEKDPGNADARLGLDKALGAQCAEKLIPAQNMLDRALNLSSLDAGSEYTAARNEASKYPECAAAADIIKRANDAEEAGRRIPGKN